MASSAWASGQDCGQAKPVGPNLIQNPGFEQAGQQHEPLAHWHHWVWAGDFQVRQTQSEAYAGRSAAVMEGHDDGRVGLFQKLKLEAGQYRLRSIVAAFQLQPGQWKRTSDVLINFTQPGLNLELPAVSQSSGWQLAVVEFNVPETQEVTLYWRSYGPGLLFIDQVNLRKLSACKAQKRLRLAKLDRPWRYRPELKAVDTALKDYCAWPEYARKELCQRRDEWPPPKQRAQGLRILENFESEKSIFVGGVSGIEQQALSGLAARIPAGKYMLANESTGLLTSWEGYDYLQFKVFNPSDSPELLYVEIRDSETRGYWSRVNWTTYVAPGIQQITMPLQIFVGEKSIIKERRRLNLNGITTLILSAVNAKAPFFVDDVHLTLEPPWQNFIPGLVKLDFGNRNSPVFSDFIQVLPTTRYQELRGFGFAPGSALGHVKDRRHPENLLRDWIEIYHGGLDFDLPDGEYRVWLMWEDPGYWENYPVVRMREVWAEEQLAYRQEQSIEEFWSAYYRHENDEDLPGDDIWARYIASRYRPVAFTVKVIDGQLNLRFGADPGGVTLSAMLLYPAADLEAGLAFEEELMQALKRQFHYEYSEVLPPSARHSGTGQTGQLQVFHRHPTHDVQASDAAKMSENVKRLDVAMARGEYEPLTLSLRTDQRDDLIDWSMEFNGQHPGINVEAQVVRYKLQRAIFDGTAYRNAPLLLDPLKVPLSLQSGVTRRLWLTVHATEDAHAGSYRGRLKLKFRRAGIRELPVHLQVHDFVLPMADIPIGYLGAAPNYPAGRFTEIQAKRERELDQSVQLLRAHGMTAVTGGLSGPSLQGYENGQLIIDYRQADLSMDAYRGKFFHPVNSYFGLSWRGLTRNRVERTQGRYGKDFETVLRDAMHDLRRHAAEKQWLPLVINIGDEPRGQALLDSLELAQVYKRIAPWQPLSVFTSFTSKDDERTRLIDHVDVFFLTHHSVEGINAIRAARKQCALYNIRDRYHRGFYLHAMKRLGCRGYFQFAFSSVGADPYYALDAREDDLAAVFTHSSGKLRKTLDLEYFREAIDDYRYWLALERLIEAYPQVTAAKRAQQELEQWLSMMAIGHDQPAPWSEVEMDSLRTRIAAHIESINQVIKAP